MRIQGNRRNEVSVNTGQWDENEVAVQSWL